MKKECILVIGVRKPCYTAALDLGYEIVLWSDGPISKRRKENLSGYIEEPYAVNKSGLSEKLIEELSKHKIDRVIAGTEQAVLLGAHVREHLNLKRLAVDVTKRFHNKFIMKNFAREYSIPITNYKLIDAFTTADELEESLGLPLVIKPVDESGARDVKVARSLSEIEAFMEPGLLAEAFVEGSEVSVETFVQDGKPIFHNITEYLHQWKKSVAPAQLPDGLRSKILEINDKVIEKFGVDRGMTHAEFYLTKNGPIFGEIAIRPPGGYYMELIKKVYEFDSWKEYVNLCCEMSVSVNENPRGCAAVYMIHPGEGRIKSITGVEEIKAKISGIFDFSIRKKVGDVISSHESTSNEVGHILFWSETRGELDTSIEYIESTLKFELF